MHEESPLLLSPTEESPAADAEPTAVPEPELIKPASESITESSFVCNCERWERLACAGQPFYKEHEGERYCVLHYPGKEKATDFENAFHKKLKVNDFDFRGVWFPDVLNLKGTWEASANFQNATFSKEVDFGSIKFSAEVSFNSATFNAYADFESTGFNAYADFESATFNADANFRNARFREDADFDTATFNKNVCFNRATFSADVCFRSAIFKDQVSFSGSVTSGSIINKSFGDQVALDLQFAQIEKPDRVSFHTVTLRPHWFVNIDSRKFAFTDVDWNWKAISIESEVQSLTEEHVALPRGLLKIACRQLAENAEMNSRYEEASRFRYWAMDLARQQKWAGLAFWKTDWLHVLYWVVSGYGERILRAFLWLIAVWLVFVWLYTQVGFAKPEDKSATPMANPITTTEPDNIGQPLPFTRAFIYSLGVMSLQKPEPQPLTGTAQTLVLLETILGPLQAALLALAIRRKFMR